MGKIVVLDSGIGGASVLKEIISCLPNYNYVYFADTKHSPYGEKSQKELFEILKKIINKLNKKSEIDALVLACNTASSLCGNLLRKIYKFPIICVEPPIKVAVSLGFKKISVLATPQTLKTNKTIKKFELIKDLEIQKVPLKNLAKEIDRNVYNLDNLYLELSKCLKNVKGECVVIGCTHYNFVKNQIETILRRKTISCEEAVAKQAKNILTENNVFEQKSKIKIILSKNDLKIRRFLKTYLTFDQS